MKKAVVVAALGLVSLAAPNVDAGLSPGSRENPPTSAYGFNADDLKADHLGRISIKRELTIGIGFSRMAGDANCCNGNCNTNNCN